MHVHVVFGLFDFGSRSSLEDEDLELRFPDISRSPFHTTRPTPPMAVFKPQRHPDLIERGVKEPNVAGTLTLLGLHTLDPVL